jgi:hypothetical protein
LSLKIRQVKNDTFRFPSFIGILKALFNLSMLANFQSNRLIGVIFIGLEKSMMDFFGKNHHIETFFLALPNTLFCVRNNFKHFLKQNISYQLDQGFRLVNIIMSCHTSIRKKSGVFFGKGSPYAKIGHNYFVSKNDNSYSNRKPWSS